MLMMLNTRSQAAVGSCSHTHHAFCLVSFFFGCWIGQEFAQAHKFKPKKAANDLVDPENEIPSPGSIAYYIEELPEADQANALAIVNDWFDNLEN